MRWTSEWASSLASALSDTAWTIAVRTKESSQVGQLSLGDIILDRAEIHFIQLEKQQFALHGAHLHLFRGAVTILPAALQRGVPRAFGRRSHSTSIPLFGQRSTPFRRRQIRNGKRSSVRAGAAE